MPVKLTEEQEQERKEKEEAKKARRELRKKQYAPDFDPEGLHKQAVNRVYRMKVLCDKVYGSGTPEYDLYETAQTVCNKMKTAFKNADQAKERELAAVATRNPQLMAEEAEAWRTHYKDFVYHQYVVGQLWTEFLEETESYGIHA